jgi:isopenicillin N synthase-like dioxygenase
MTPKIAPSVRAERIPVEQEEGDLKEATGLATTCPLPFHGPNQWPTDVPGFRETMEAYFAAVPGLAREVTNAVAVALELPEDYFNARVRRRPTSGRSARPASAPAPTPTTAAWPWPKTTGADYKYATWPGSGSSPSRSGGTFVVNVGDMLARWTNDLFPPTLHRVINTSGAERQSIPFFSGWLTRTSGRPEPRP